MLKQGKANLGLGIEAQFLQRSEWGKEGDHLDTFTRNEWIDQTGEELRRARKSQGFSLN